MVTSRNQPLVLFQRSCSEIRVKSLTSLNTHEVLSMNCRKVDVESRKGEKGAALVMSILISTLLLAVAGTVILTSGMSATTSIDATAELQAYYGAETGLEASLNVIRGHVQPNGIAGTTRIGFRNAVDTAKSNRSSDPSTTARLS